MRKLATAVLWVFVLVLFLDAKDAQAQNGVVTFKFTNNANYTIYMKMYSQNRNHVWPDVSTHFILDDNQERIARLACQVGENICYGGGYSTDGTGTYWGTGYQGNKGCRGCCLTCGTAGQDVWHSWSLTD